MLNFVEVVIAFPSPHCDTNVESTAATSESSASTVGICGHMLEIWTTPARLRAARDIAMDVSVVLLMFEEGSRQCLGFRGWPRPFSVTSGACTVKVSLWDMWKMATYMVFLLTG